jgi:LPXTG-site transpeptidase (sortase) family protein
MGICFGNFARTKYVLKWGLLAIAIAAVAFSPILFFLLDKNSPALAAKTYKFEYGETANLGVPVRLKIPSINVDAALESVGLTPGGAVGVPKGTENAAWFDLSPRPGEKGSAVIDGHYGWWKNNTPTVFNNLGKLRKGDKLYVQDETGVIITFVVRESRKFNPGADAAGVFASGDGKSHLNLITCDGVWNDASKNYPDRLVVFTDREVD